MPFDPNLPFEEVDETDTLSFDTVSKPKATGFDFNQPFEEVEDTEDQAQFDADYFRPKPLRTEKEKQEIGTIEGISNAAKNAFDSSRQAMDVVGGVSPEEAQNIAKIEFNKKSRKLAPGYDEYQKAEGLDAAFAFAKNPIEVTSNIIAEGLAGSLPALGAGLAAGGVGAAAGSVVPVLGTGAGFLTGQVAGTFAGSLATEYGSKVLEELQGEGMDITDPNSIQTFFGNEELVGKARDKALKRGVPIAAFDALSAGIGGKLGRVFGTKVITEGEKIIGKQFATKTGEAATELGVQAGLGGGGEIAGSLVAGEPIEGKAVFGEVIGEVGPGSIEVLTGRIADKRAMAKAQEDAKIKAAADLSTTLEENSSPLTASVVTAKSATNIEQDKLAAQLDEELSLTAVKPSVAAPVAIPTKDDYVARYSAIAQTAPEELTRAEQAFTNELATADTEEKRVNAQNALDAIKEVKTVGITPTVTPPVTPVTQPPITDATQEIIQPEGVRQEPQDGTQIRQTTEAGVSDSLLGTEGIQEEGQVDPIVVGLQAVTNNTATREQIASLSLSGLVDVRRGQAIINEDGEGILAQAQAPLPTLTPEERAAEIEATPVTPIPVEPTIGEIPQTSPMIGEQPAEPIISEIPKTSKLVGVEPAEPIISEKLETSDIVGAEPPTIVEQEQVAPTEQPAVSTPTSGQPFEFFSVRNTEKAPQLGSQFGQDIEPSGKYVSESTPSAAQNLDERFEKETVRFESPLVVDFGGEYGTPTNWKNVLSGQYGGKTGGELSQAVRDAGYDGIVTVEPAKGPNRPASTSEIVDIRGIQPSATTTTLAPAEATAITPAPVAETPAVAPAAEVALAEKPVTILETKNILGKPGQYKTEPRQVDYNKMPIDDPFTMEGDQALLVFPDLQFAANMAESSSEEFVRATTIGGMGGELQLPQQFDPNRILVGKKTKSKKTRPAFTSASVIKKEYGDLEIPIPSSDFSRRAIVIEDTNGETRSIAVGNRTGAGGVIASRDIKNNPLTSNQIVPAGTAKRVYVFDTDAVYGNSIKIYDIAESKPTAVTTPAVSETITPTAEPAGISVGNRIKLGKSPQTYTIEGIIPQTKAEVENDEQFYSVKNERTGEVQVVEARDLKPVKKMPIRKAIADAVPTPDDKLVPAKDIINAVMKMFGKDFVGEYLTLIDDVNEKAKAAYEISSGTIYINRAYLSTDDNIRDYIAHELGHYIAGDPTMTARFQEFFDSLPAKDKAKLDRFVENVYNDETGEVRLEEKQVYAFIIRLNAGENRSAFQTLMDAIKKWLNKNFKTKFKMTDRDAAAILAGAVERFKSGEFIPREEGFGTREATAALFPKTEEEGNAFEKASSNKVMQRNPQLAVAAVRLKNGEITSDEYADMIDALDPFTIKGADSIPAQAKINQYISDEKISKVNATIQTGKEVELRIDIPTYNRSTAAGDTVYAVTAHEPVPETSKQVGTPISYLGVAKVINPKMMTRSISGKGEAIDIATGAGKFPLATVKGNYEPITELPANINDPNAWTEVSYNPIRSSYFVDVRSKNAIVGGDEAIMVGSRVFVKNPQMQSRPTGIVGGAGVKNIRYAKAVGEPRREQVAGEERGDIITTPEGIIKQTNEVLRNKFFDGSVVSDENTSAAWDYIEQLLDIESGAANALAGQINDVVDQETNSDSRMGASLFSISLANYSAKLAAQGDNTMISYIIRRINRMPIDNLAGGASDIARALRGRREYNIDGYKTLETEHDSKVERTAAALFGTGKPSEEQVAAVDAAIKASEDTPIGESEEVAGEVEKVEKRTGRKVIKKIEDQISGNIEEKRKAALEKQKTRPTTPSGVERQALSIIDQFARMQSDTLAFTEKQENLVRSIVQQDLRQRPDMKRKQPWTSQLTAKLIQAGASETQAETISDLVWRQHEIKAMDRELKELQTAAEKGSLAVIIQRIKDTPLEEQQKPEWMQGVIREYLIEAGLSSQAADTAARLYESVIAERFAEAKQKAFEATLAKSAPWNNYLSRNAQLGKNALKRIQDAIRTGVLDPTQTTEGIIAKESGWSGFSKEQLTRIVQLDGVLSDDANNQVDKAEAMSELNKIIVKAKMPVRFKDAIGAYYVAQALMGIPTLLVNIVSPVGFSVRNMITDIGKYSLTEPSRIPMAFETFLDSMKSWYNQTSYAFKNQIYMNDVVEYLQGQNVLRELFDRGKDQWAKGDYANGMANMLVGMTQITGRVLSSLDQGAISALENQNITRYAMEAMKQNNIPQNKRKEFANMILHMRRQTYMENVSNGMASDRAGVLADLAVRNEIVTGLSEMGVRDKVLDSAINDALQTVGRNKTIDTDRLTGTTKKLSDEGILSYLPISFLENIASGAAKQGPAMQVFSKMLYGFALVPARVFHTTAWYSPYGFVRLAVDKYKKNKGEDSPYAMSLQTELQYKQRLTETIAGSVVMLGLAALAGSSTDDDEEKKFRIVITGNGPSYSADKQYYDAWHKKYKPYSFHIVMGDTIIPINIGRGGEALFFPIMLAGALDDWKIKEKLNLAKKEPKELNLAVEALGSAFFALAQRGPYAAFTKPLFDASKDGKITEELVGQAGFFGKTFIPILGSSLSRNISEFINDPVERSSLQGAIYANTPIVGPWLGTKALNALGQPMRADDWGDKLFKLGVPAVFSFPKNTPENELNELILKKGSGPSIPTRSNAQKRFGDVLTDKEFETYVREYGRVVSDKMFKNRKKLENMSVKNYDDELEGYVRGYSVGDTKITGAADMAVRAVKRSRNE